jgi:hypothetical protein
MFRAKKKFLLLIILSFYISMCLSSQAKSRGVKSLSTPSPTPTPSPSVVQSVNNQDWLLNNN